MSVTITITNNEQHCQLEGLVETESYDCQCEGLNQHCPLCEGRAKVHFARYPYELNLKNGNFCRLTQYLELGWDNCGIEGPAKLTSALKLADAPALTRPSRRYKNCISMGTDEDQSQRWLDQLQIITVEATKRGEQITWG